MKFKKNLTKKLRTTDMEPSMKKNKRSNNNEDFDAEQWKQAYITIRLSYY